MLSFSDLKKNLKKDTAGFQPVRVALLADHASQFLHTAIKGYGVTLRLNLELFEADYNQIEQLVYDPGSALYAFEPAYVIIIRSTEHLLHTFYRHDKRDDFSDLVLRGTADLYQYLSGKLNTRVIINTYVEINDFVFGNYAAKTAGSFLYQLRKLNLGLMDLARGNKDLHISDFASLSALKGYEHSFDPKMYISADMVFSIDFLPFIAQSIVQLISATLGHAKKCLILDLDNTLWGGIIGDDGPENIQIGSLGIGKAFTELQLWCRELKNRGVILAVCSKNTAHIARQPFDEHPDMVLKTADITVFVANWNNKVDNIHSIQQTLNIGTDTMVFLDDNPFEREMTRTAIPGLTVPELPPDPVDYLSFLRSLNLFETASFTAEDTNRTMLYQQEAKRNVASGSYANENDYLKSLDMVAGTGGFDKFTIPRVAQLALRSNQFNLRTIRYSEMEIARIAADDNYHTIYFTLADRFGDHGLIAAVILHQTDPATLFIDTWIMSCRVLKRGMEDFTLDAIVEKAIAGGFKTIAGEYVPTAKNGLVKNHYADLGFVQKGNLWILGVAGHTGKEYFIKKHHE